MAVKQPRSSVLITANYRLITPAYLRGADQARAELRTASFKGVLRFWWRALQWPRQLEEHSGDSLEALKALHRDEARLFGISASKRSSGLGQGVLRQLQLNDCKFGSVQRNRGRGVDPLEAYMLGQGLAQKADNGFMTTSSALPEKTTFKLSLSLVDAEPSDIAGLLQAIRLLGSLGGIGARSRRGMGSLAITGVAVDGREEPLPGDVAQMEAWLVGLRNGCPDMEELAPFTALSRGVQFCFQTDTDLGRLMSKVAATMNRFRTNGRGIGGKRIALDGTELDRETLEFWNDHEWVDAVLQKKPGNKEIPERTAFGLPHNYFFSSPPKRKAEVKPQPASSIERRASPLLIHYHTFGAIHCAVLSYWPAKYLPDGVKVGIYPEQRKGGKETDEGDVADGFESSPRTVAENTRVMEKFLRLFNERKAVQGPVR